VKRFIVVVICLGRALGAELEETMFSLLLGAGVLFTAVFVSAIFDPRWTRAGVALGVDLTQTTPATGRGLCANAREIGISEELGADILSQRA
jgi:hypothetical protein